MRILFSFAGGNGHFQPLLPLAKLASEAGHSIAFTGRAGMLPLVEAAGFAAFPSGRDFGDSAERLPLLEMDMAREERALTQFFGGSLARERAKDIQDLAQGWQADLILCDEIDFGAMLAAERLGLPYASLIVIAAGSFVRKELLSAPLNALRAELGLAPDPDLEMLSRHLVLSPLPPSYREPAFPLPATAFSFKPFEAKGELPDERFKWITRLEKPLIYFTLGTIFNRESGDLFSRVIQGLSDLPIQVIVTLGQHIEASEFGEVAANIHLAQYIPQHLLLPHCAMVISHAGSGSLMGALAHGLPSVLLPMGADQPLNASRCKDLGVAEVLDVMSASPETIRQAVLRVLENERYRRAAEKLREDFLALPPLEAALRRVEALVLGHSV